MAEMIAEAESLESTTVGIYRTAAVVKGGRRFSFAALVVVGDRGGRVGLGYGKAPGVPAAIEKAQKDARRAMQRVDLLDGTISHAVTSRFGASIVRLIPAAPGTGVIAGATVRAVLELAGVRDCLTKAYGSRNQKNLAKAVLQGLAMARSKQTVAALRGVDIDKTEVEDRIEQGVRYAPKVTEGEKMEAPKSTVKSQRGGGRRGGGGRGRGGRGRDQAPASAPPAGGEAAASQGGTPATEGEKPAAEGENASPAGE